MIGGAWPFLVRGVICLLNCVSENRFLEVIACLVRVSVLADSPCNLEGNERDRNLLLPFFRLFGELLPRDLFQCSLFVT